MMSEKRTSNDAEESNVNTRVRIGHVDACVWRRDLRQPCEAQPTRRAE